VTIGDSFFCPLETIVSWLSEYVPSLENSKISAVKTAFSFLKTKYCKDPELNDVVYYIDFYTKEYIKSKVTKVTQSNFIRVEYKSSTGKLKTRNIDTNLLFQIKD